MKRMKCRFLYITAELVLLFIFAFVGNPVSVFAQTSKSSSKKAADQKTVVAEPKTAAVADELDAAIRETSDYLNKQLTKGNKLMILNVQSDFPALSEYIIDELTANTVNDRIFSVVDRQQLNTIRAELNFQMSGEVDDQTAQSLGRMAGAQIIISGAVSKIGDLYRLRIRALSVQSAQIEGQFNKNIPSNPTITALVNSKATGYGGTTAQTSAAPAKATTTTTTSAPATAQAAAPTPAAPKTYNIGDKGPAGGIVFYDKFSTTGGWRYLEAAPKETEQKFPWGNVSVGGTSVALGDGKRNTELIALELQKNKIGGAAQYCDDLEYGGFTDWFLPSKDELDLMYQNLKDKKLGDFRNEIYWSSSYGNFYRGYLQNFRDGSQDDISNLNTSNWVRAVRRF